MSQHVTTLTRPCLRTWRLCLCTQLAQRRGLVDQTKRFSPDVNRGEQEQYLKDENDRALARAKRHAGELINNVMDNFVPVSAMLKDAAHVQLNTAIPPYRIDLWANSDHIMTKEVRTIIAQAENVTSHLTDLEAEEYPASPSEASPESLTKRLENMSQQEKEELHFNMEMEERAVLSALQKKITTNSELIQGWKALQAEAGQIKFMSGRMFRISSTGISTGRESEAEPTHENVARPAIALLARNVIQDSTEDNATVPYHPNSTAQATQAPLSEPGTTQSQEHVNRKVRRRKRKQLNSTRLVEDSKPVHVNVDEMKASSTGPVTSQSQISTSEQAKTPKEPTLFELQAAMERASR